MKTKIKLLQTLLVVVLLSNISYGQEFSNFSNVEEFFKLTKKEVENKIVNENGYRLKSKDKDGTITYIKKNSVYTFAVNLVFKGDKLKIIGWNDVINRGQFIVSDIGNDVSYKIDETKTNDYLGVFTSKSIEKGFVVSIFKTQPNLQKGMISFTLSNVGSSKTKRVNTKETLIEKETKENEPALIKDIFDKNGKTYISLDIVQIRYINQTDYKIFNQNSKIRTFEVLENVKIKDNNCRTIAETDYLIKNRERHISKKNDEICMFSSVDGIITEINFGCWN
ncbi:hypothetical protein FLBR109950_08530 [Flavobacterium branchiophilum]|uniref:Uncharacterized protein n=1 Tax=Flavobacterium branchiophilum (strain FL-15) TaxID=1034807 RepID=G2Z045_FLABF|nr:hypothetical protein [Flavobacterium branchiophilum]CCB70318.1 Hypothetical protein precursor [Flavobacterium branchiophilum FL-15]